MWIEDILNVWRLFFNVFLSLSNSINLSTHYLFQKIVGQFFGSPPQEKVTSHGVICDEIVFPITLQHFRQKG